MDGKAQAAEALYNAHLHFEAAGRLDQAQQALRQAARLGSPDALHALAYALDRNDEKPQRMLRLYRQAARAGSGASALNIARYYQRREKTALALRWLRVAADLGDEDANAELAAPGAWLCAAVGMT